MKIYFDEHINDFIYSAGIPKWRVTAVQPQKDYTLILTFVNGEKRLYNALPLLEKSIYSPLKNLAFFMSAKVDGDSVAWSDEIDIAPEHLYECSNPVEITKRFIPDDIATEDDVKAIKTAERDIAAGDVSDFDSIDWGV